MSNDADGSIDAWRPVARIEGSQVPLTPTYAPQTRWDRLLRRPKRFIGWSFKAPKAGTVVDIEWGPRP